MSWRRRPDVALVLQGGPMGTAFLARLPTGPMLRLDGPGAALIRAVEAASGDIEDVAIQLAGLLQVCVGEVDRIGIREFCDDLADQGYLMRGSP